jgi:hypothetical protein
MARKKKEKANITLEFEPGCFDNFEGTQEELDNFVAQVHAMFEGKTSEDIKAMSHPVDWDELAQEEPGLYEHLVSMADKTDRKLQ